MLGRDGKADAAFDLLPDREAEQQVAPADAPQFGERQQRRRNRRGRMDHGAQMGVAEVVDIGAGGVEEGGAQRVDALATPDDGRLLAAGELRER